MLQVQRLLGNVNVEAQRALGAKQQWTTMFQTPAVTDHLWPVFMIGMIMQENKTASPRSKECTEHICLTTPLSMLARHISSLPINTVARIHCIITAACFYILSWPKEKKKKNYPYYTALHSNMVNYRYIWNPIYYRSRNILQTVPLKSALPFLFISLFVQVCVCVRAKLVKRLSAWA